MDKYTSITLSCQTVFNSSITCCNTEVNSSCTVCLHVFRRPVFLSQSPATYPQAHRCGGALFNDFNQSSIILF